MSADTPVAPTRKRRTWAWVLGTIGVVAGLWPAQRQSRNAQCTLRVQVAVADTGVKDWLNTAFSCGCSS